MVKGKQSDMDRAPVRRPLWRCFTLAGGGLIIAGYLLPLAAGLGMERFMNDMSGANRISVPVYVPASDVDIVFDTTGVKHGERVTEQQIIDTLLLMIDSAGELIILDMFLVNQFRGRSADAACRDTTGELIEALVRKQRKSPQTWILFITDPINNVYGEGCPSALQPLVDAGGTVVVTDLGQLPASNPLYSWPYLGLRPLLRRITPLRTERFPNPLDPQAARVSAMQYLDLLNFKANHRKTAVVLDKNGHWNALVTSANPHSASSVHGNVAAVVRSGAVLQLYKNELLIARASLLRRPELCYSPSTAHALVRQIEQRLQQYPETNQSDWKGNETMVQFCSEAEIGNRVDHMLKTAVSGDTVQMMMFYLSDPLVVRALRDAARRGVEVRILLDPNKDAFGREKGGIPNRPVATDLQDRAYKENADLLIRWFETHGEQAHYKGLHIWNREMQKNQLLIGSANFTRRNLRGYNLEMSVYIENAHELGEKWRHVFEQLWGNADETVYSEGFDRHAVRGAEGLFKKGVTALANFTGFCTY